MGKLIPEKIEGTFNGAVHHKIAATLGLIMGRELIFATLPKDKDTLNQKILAGAAK